MAQQCRVVVSLVMGDFFNFSTFNTSEGDLGVRP